MNVFDLRIGGFRHDPELQIVQADVYMAVEDEVLVDEAVCVDVGLPALLHSAGSDLEPYRWAAPHEWQRMPFFVCGCGDPECRAYSFVVRHAPNGAIRLTEVEERQEGPNRVLGEYEVSRDEFREKAAAAVREFLDYMEGRDYRPLFADTIPVLRRLLSE